MAEQAREPELLPCPFCGGDAETIGGADTGGMWVRIACSACGIGTHQHSLIIGNGKARAAEAWNKRLTPPGTEPAAPEGRTVEQLQADLTTLRTFLLDDCDLSTWPSWWDDKDGDWSVSLERVRLRRLREIKPLLAPPEPAEVRGEVGDA